MIKEQKSKEYAELKVKQYDKNNTIGSYGMNRAMQQCYFDGYELQDAFEEGWDEAMEHLFKLPLDVIVDEIIKEVKGD